MTPREYAKKLRKKGHTYESIRMLVGQTFGKSVSLWTIYYWLRPERQKQIREYQREWQRRHRAKQKPPGKPVVDRERFDTNGPFE